ncbi:MAG: DUF4350 domain-containing protein [Saprospiraceae bacterium]|nr:DUF4350 domain-containing protein [Saprospiraceae bacterium]
MSKKQIPYIIAALMLLLALLFYILKGNGKTNYSWREHYDPNSKDPYGTYLVRNLLETYYPGQPFEVVMDSLGERLDSGIFIYVGNEFSLDSLTLNQLLRFVERGNQAFIACSYIPQGLLDSLNDEACVSSDSYGEDSPFSTVVSTTLRILS